jgi:4-amino-4-deoxy-L-arabinose transferase-like glycosyltransferase
MRTKMSSEQPGKSKDITRISILLAIAMCVGAYLISTTVIIAKDGVTFIEYAKNLTVSPIRTMLGQNQHPGYSFLILTAHRIAKLAYEGPSFWSWIYSAQIVALIFRLLTIVVLYFVGKEIVGPRFSFLAILILILLPKPAEYGSDALTDWPHLFFLSAGFLLLLRGAINRKSWLFGFAGLLAGLGYLIRPECAQLVVLGFLWLALQLFWTKRIISQRKVALALVLLFVGFIVTAGPYMKLKGAVFPKKNIGRFNLNTGHQENYGKCRELSNSMDTAGFAPTNVTKAVWELFEQSSDLLMWFFVPALLIGTYRYFKEKKLYEPEAFFIAALIALNIPTLIWLYCNYGYIDGRHVLPLVTFTIFYVPFGLQTFVNWLNAKLSKIRLETKQNPQLWLFILTTAGLFVCVPKLLTPLNTDKQIYREAAQWLAENTDEKDIVAVSDIRISFYAERQGLYWKDGEIPEQAQYIVKIFKQKNDKTRLPEQLGKIEYKYADKRNDKVSVAIYRKS